MPVNALVAAAQRISSGDLSTKIETNKIKELDTLGATFNEMSENLAGHITNLAKAAAENRELFVGMVKALRRRLTAKTDARAVIPNEFRASRSPSVRGLN